MTCKQKLYSSYYVVPHRSFIKFSFFSYPSYYLMAVCTWHRCIQKCLVFNLLKPADTLITYFFFPPAYYLFQSLLSIRQDDKVVCPRTKEVFNFSQAEKVYIMWSLRWTHLSINMINYGLKFITCELAYSESHLWSCDPVPPPPKTHPTFSTTHRPLNTWSTHSC